MTVFSLDETLLDERLFLDSSFKRQGQSVDSRREELDGFSNDIDVEISSSPDNSKLLYYKYKIIMQYVYLISEDDPLKKTKKSKLVESARGWLNKSILADSGDLTVPHLFQIKSLGGVFTVYAVNGLVLLSNDELFALRGNEFEFLDKDRVNVIREKIVALIKLEEFEEARLEINELRENYPQRFKQTSVAYYEEEISIAIEKLQSVQSAIVPAIEKPKEELVEKNVIVDVADEIKELPSDIQVENVAPQRTINSYWLFLFVAIIVLGLFIYKRKRNK
jgi:hypothetical protein